MSCRKIHHKYHQFSTYSAILDGKNVLHMPQLKKYILESDEYSLLCFNDICRVAGLFFSTRIFLYVNEILLDGGSFTFRS